MATTSIAESKTAECLGRLERRSWSRADEFTGSKADLIGAGLVRDGQFPGDPGRGSTMVTYDAQHRPVGRGNNRNAAGYQIRRASRQQFSVAIYVEPEERARRQQTLDQEHQVKWEREKAARETQKASEHLAAMSCTAKQHAKKCADDFWMLFCTFLNMHCASEFGTAGYRFDDELIDELRSMGSDLFYEIKRSTLLSDYPNRAKRLEEARAQEAKLDGSLQQFLGALPTLPILEIEERGCRKKASRWSATQSRQRRYVLR